MLIKACLNGSRSRREYPWVPASPAELAAEAARAVAAGAHALHVHPRDGAGRETLDGRACAEALTAIRRACPGTPVGVSTGLWIEGDAGRRRGAIERWTERPDFASVNFSESGAVELCEQLLARGVGVEAGLWRAADAHLFVECGLAGRCLRVLLEPRETVIQEAVETGDAIAAVLDGHKVSSPRLLHAEGPPAWGVLDAALTRGYDIRIGFEDTLVLPDGRPAASNAELLAAALDRVRRHHPHPLPDTHRYASFIGTAADRARPGARPPKS